ncbi:MAG: potassium/proton antiporter [Anaerotignum sp.]
MFTIFLVTIATIMFACLVFNKISNRLGIPMLLIFILLGMIFGSDGLVKISFDDYVLAEQICTVALIFIMFYGGFGTKWSKAKPVAVKAILLSSLGTVITAVLVGVFCYFALKFDLLESFLVGAVISSTDAASVFSILRLNRLNLRYNTASILEVESGSNDPFAYMLTIVVLSIMGGNSTAFGFGLMLIKQISIGLFFGGIVGVITNYIMNNFKFSVDGFDTIFIVAVAITSYSTATIYGGNGYLSVYLTGLILGNMKMNNKKSLVHFFDAITGLMQMLLFFLLGLLSFPSQLLDVAVPAICIFLFLTFIARPLAVFAVLAPFRSKFNQQLLIAWSGMRGAASIVFAIVAVTSPQVTENDIFHIVFFIVLLSILFQGTLIPHVARLFKMVDDKSDVLKTFTDYSDEVPIKSIEFNLGVNHSWIGAPIANITLPPDSVIALVIRKGDRLRPSGQLVLLEKDTLILVGNAIDRKNEMDIYEKEVKKDNDWVGKRISEIKISNLLILMIRRGGNVIIPKGDTTILENDIIVINEIE